MKARHKMDVIVAVVTLFLMSMDSAITATYYVAPSGSDANSGSAALPFATLKKVHDLAKPGDVIYMRGGVYQLSEGVLLTRSGDTGSYIHVFAYPGEQPILDGSRMTQVGYYEGWPLVLTNAGWNHIKGLEIRNGPMGGMVLTGNSHDNIIENNNVHHNGRLSQWEGKGISMYDTAHHNLLLNNDSHHNRDLHGDNADGFQIGSVGSGNVLRGNRAWRNADDGFDFWNGAPVFIESNWAWENGYDDLLNPVGDGNGFKLGGQTAGRSSGGHVVTNNLAWGNKTNGFDENSASIAIALYNNTAWNNGGFNFSFWKQANTFRNNVSFGSRGVAASGSADHNSWSLRISVTTADFASLNSNVAVGPRNADGSLPTTAFLHLATGSKLIDVGTDVGLPYSDKAPDLGAYEYALPTSPQPASRTH